ncbi:MAG TPA: zf-HC2 domain-containing protein [Myxococcales bacterium]
MTHAECQDLLLDLAYGELDAARAAEVQSHLAGCEDCQRDQAQIAQARRMASPLRAVEEPSARFDGRILAAARAEASLQSDGLPGQVIEVKGSVSPMGLQAARIDSLAAVTAPSRRKPRWALRVALGGSVAAAAALALVMSTTLQSRKAEQPAAAQYEIRVGQVAEKAQREAISRAEEAKKPAPAEPSAPAPVAAAAPRPPPPVKEEPRPAAEKKLAARAKAVSRDEQSPLAGSGGDTADALAPHGGASEAVAAGGAMGAMGPAASHGAPPAAAPQPLATRVAANEGKADSPGGRMEMQRLAKAAPAAAEDVNAGFLESRAQEARRSGNYTLAASNYRRAAALRQAASDKDSGTAAWDLTHAVECLASAGLFDEARLVGAELLRLYPTESAAVSAANRALRPGDLPAAAQTAPAKAAQPAQQQPVKAPDEKRQDAATPAQH